MDVQSALVAGGAVALPLEAYPIAAFIVDVFIAPHRLLEHQKLATGYPVAND